MISIEVGRLVTGNWGAMHPIQEGVIAHKSEDGFCVIKWDDTEEEALQNFMIRDIEIHQPGWTCVNGSSIGVFVQDE